MYIISFLSIRVFFVIIGSKNFSVYTRVDFYMNTLLLIKMYFISNYNNCYFKNDNIDTLEHFRFHMVDFALKRLFLVVFNGHYGLNGTENTYKTKFYLKNYE